MAAAGPDPMLPHLGAAAREARVKAGRLQVHIAAELGAKTDATVRRFEQGLHWPRDPDAMVNAYARDLDIDAREIWAAALKRWRAES